MERLDIMEIYEKILFLRKELLQVSGTEFARRCGVDRRTLYSWESGQSKPSLHNKAMIAIVCSITLDFLLNDETDIELYISDVDEKAYKILKEIALEYKAINERKEKYNVR